MNLRTFAAFVIGLSAAGFASAQSGTLRANVPFDFVVNGTTLPAGEYSVIDSPTHGSILIKGVGQAVSAVSLVNRAVDKEPGKTARLVFHAYGDRYFLFQTWTGDEGRELPRTHSERDLARQQNPNHPVAAAIRLVALHL